MPANKKQSMKRLVKILLAGLFLLVLFKSVGFGALVEQLENINYIYFSLFLFISLPMIWASCMKWALFLDDQVKVVSLMRLYIISYFVNLFAPSTIGGDVARSFGLGKKINSQSKALAATFFERLTGLLTMLALSAVSLICSKELLQAFGYYVLFFLLITLFIGGLFFVHGVRVVMLNIVLKMLSLASKFPGYIKIKTFFESLKEEVSFSGRVIFKSFLWSAVFHGLTIINTYLAGKSIGVENLDMLSLTAVVPMVLLVLTIPLTPGGLGVQEGAFVFLLTKVGISSPEALAISLLLRLKNLILSGVGGLLLMRRG